MLGIAVADTVSRVDLAALRTSTISEEGAGQTVTPLLE